MPACAPVDYVVRPNTTRSPSHDIPIRVDGDEVFFTDGVGVYTGNEGAPKLVGTLPKQTSVGPDGKSFDWSPPVSAFWIERDRFIIGSYAGVWTLPRAGGEATQIAVLPPDVRALKFARDEAYLYIAGISGSIVHVYRTPLAGGIVDDLAQLGASGFPTQLEVDASSIYVLGLSLLTDIQAIPKNGGPARSLSVQGSSILGFDGHAFVAMSDERQGGPRTSSSTTIERRTPDGSVTRAWTGGDLTLVPEGFATANDAAYVIGWVGERGSPDTQRQSFVRIPEDGSAASVSSCLPDSNHLIMNAGVGGNATYALVVDDSAEPNTWGIARLPR
jgi:hypothetical protein